MTTKRKYCSDDYPPHDLGGCPNCAPQPSIVAECWTCDIYGMITNGARAQYHRAAGHDVREVKRGL